MVSGNTLISSEGHFFVIVPSPGKGWISRCRTPPQWSLIRVRCFIVALIRRMSYSSLGPALKRGVPPRCITFRQGLLYCVLPQTPQRFTTHLYFVSNEWSALNATPLSFNSIPKQYLIFVQNIKSRKTRPLNSVAICDGILGEGGPVLWHPYIAEN